MNIAGYQKTTLKDYPGKVAAICFSEGCQLRCPYCHNPNLVLPRLYSTSEEIKHNTDSFFNYIKKRKKLLDGVVFSGGEPLLQDNLEDILSELKDDGFSIKLDTNGLLPERLKTFIDKELLDYVALDYKNSFEGWSKATGIKHDTSVSEQYKKWQRSLEILDTYGIEYELRTTVVKEIHSSQYLISMAKELKASIKNSNPIWFLQIYEKQNDVLADYSSKKRELSSYSKEEMIELRDSISQFMPRVRLRE